MHSDLSSLALAHAFLREQVKPGATVIDATVGRGKDTSFLCTLVGEKGAVFGFDVQQEALDSARELLAKKGQEATLYHESHSQMAQYFAPDSVDAIVFNFGWLPGGDHSIATYAESSIAAIEAGLSLLKPNGVMSLCIYYGKDTGYAERDALLAYFPTLDSNRYTVLVQQFVNRPNDPPIPVQIYRNE